MSTGGRPSSGFVFDLEYQRLIADPRAGVKALLEYRGLPWDEACVEFYDMRRKIRTASNAQVRRPVYADSVGLWKRYEAQLEPLKSAIRG